MNWTSDPSVSCQCVLYTIHQAYAEALLVIPKVLAQNSGHDPQESIVKLQVRVLQPWPSAAPGPIFDLFVALHLLECVDTIRCCHLIFPILLPSRQTGGVHSLKDARWPGPLEW